jgi:hypothetical protein
MIGTQRVTHCLEEASAAAALGSMRHKIFIFIWVPVDVF